jgi:hypothetical protein
VGIGRVSTSTTFLGDRPTSRVLTAARGFRSGSGVDRCGSHRDRSDEKQGASITEDEFTELEEGEQTERNTA